MKKTYVLRNFLKELLKNPLFSGSMVMVLGSNFANFVAYLYHVIFGRLFDPSQYGELAATFSIVGMIASAITFLSLVIVKFVSAAENKKDREKYLRWFVIRGGILGVVVCLVFIALTGYLSEFLHVDSKIIFLIGPILLCSVLSLVFKSFLQGTLKFKQTVIVTNTEMIGRLVLGVLFVYLGFAVYGALLGLLLSSVLGILLGKWYLSEYSFTRKEKSNVDTQKVLSYSLPILISSIAMNALISMDLVLVKHFFSPDNAGIYASVATLGKMIFYGTAPVAAVMFPLVSKKHAAGENYIKVFLLSLLMTVGVSGAVLLVFFILPEITVGSVYGNKYLTASSYLFMYGIFVTLFTLASLILNFYLSIGKTKLIWFCVAASMVQIGGIWIFHTSLSDVILVSIVSALFFLVSLLLYFVVDIRKTPKNRPLEIT
jgi:O-antigen/teichoic acid export membrane protein